MQAEMKQVHDFLKAVGTYYIATVDGEQARVRPFGTIHEFEGKLYFQTGLVKDCCKQMLANPNIEICACKGPEWIRVAGKAIYDERIEPQKSLLDDYPMLQARYAPGDGNNAVFYLEDVTATFYSFTAEPKSVKF